MYRVIGFLCLLLLAACASKTTEPVEQNKAAVYFQEGEAAFESGLYTEAIASWEKVRETYYSPELNALAELKIAEAYYLREDYAEASVAYEEFLKNHPGHAKTADILFLLGLSYHKQILNFDQDQTPTRNALNTFRTMKQRYPDDPRMQQVDAYIANELNRLADHELDIARFYLKTDHYGASIGRYEGILKKYPDYDRKDEVYCFLGEAYFENGDHDKATEAFNTLFEKYTNSEFIDEAREFIEDNS